jgi:hypothetical protein
MLQKKEEFYLLKRTKVKECKIISSSDPLQGPLLLPSCHPSSDPLVPLYLTSHGEIPSFVLKNSNNPYRFFVAINTALTI